MSEAAPLETRGRLEGRLSEEVEWQLVLTLYNQRSLLLIGPIILMIVSVVSWFETGQSWLLSWAGAIAGASAGRLYLERAFFLLYVKTVRLLCVNEENLELVAESRRSNAELAVLNERLEVAATTDSLTGLANRRRFDAVLLIELGRAHVSRPISRY